MVREEILVGIAGLSGVLQARLGASSEVTDRVAAALVGQLAAGRPTDEVIAESQKIFTTTPAPAGPAPSVPRKTQARPASPPPPRDTEG
jgi:hypothetical protein